MPHEDRPQLRPHLRCELDERTGEHIILFDQLRLSRTFLRLGLLQFEWLKLFDGSRTLREIQAEAILRLDGQLVPFEMFERLARVLDEALFLDSPRYHQAVSNPVRSPCCLGVYEEDPQALRDQMCDLFSQSGASGLPGTMRNDNLVRAALVPHIDYGRGGLTYTYAFREVVESTAAELFVIIGTSHYSPHRFTLTRKHFMTPLGVVPTDQRYIDRLVAHYGDGLFDDEVRAHLPEHSIELEVVLLQYLYERKRQIRIVPLVVGSFEDCVLTGFSPTEAGDVQRMVRALAAVEAEMNEPICYLISGDLAHIGPKFSDPQPVHPRQLEHCRRQDQALLQQTVNVDCEGYFRIIAEERDARRICGLPPTWTTLAAVRPARGRVLHYDQYVHPEGFESVSFASVAFYRE
jgi:AmmeMemoRadiSam system protein B